LGNRFASIQANTNAAYLPKEADANAYPAGNKRSAAAARCADIAAAFRLTADRTARYIA
jgi:hypothetical protein